MKKLILFVLFISVLNSYSQNRPEEATELISTTTEEYNYLTKGLKIQIESGLDMKKGYELDIFWGGNHSNYNYQFAYLIETAKNQVKGISVKIYSSVSKNEYYLCIPINDESLFNEYNQRILSFAEPLAKSYAYMLSKCFSLVSESHINLLNEKRKK